MRQSRDMQKLLIIIGSAPLEKEYREQFSTGMECRDSSSVVKELEYEEGYFKQ